MDVMIKRYSNILAIIFIGVSSLLFLTIQLGDWSNLLYRPGSSISDLTITFWPNAYFLKQTIIENHQYPLWRPTIFSGSPIDGDPQAGLFYIPNFILLLFPLTLGFNLLFWIHIVFGGVGAWFLARSLGICRGGSLITAIVYAFSPKIFAHLGFGHVGIFYSAAYIPWIYWSCRHMLLNQRRYLFIFALFLGVQIIINPQIAIYTGMACWFYALVKAVQGSKKSEMFEIKYTLPGRLFFASILAALVAAIQILPMLRFATFIGRQGLNIQDTGISSIPYRYLLGLLLADHNGYMEYMLYTGVVPLIFAFFSFGTRIGKLGWLSIILGLLFAVGTNSPFYWLIYQLLPPLKWLRSPGRIWFTLLPIIALLAGLGFQKIKRGVSKAYQKKLNLSLTAVTSFGILLPLGKYILAGDVNFNLIMFSVLSTATLFIVVLMASQKISKNMALNLVVGFILLDLWVMNGTLIEGRKESTVLLRPEFIANITPKMQNDHWRIYSPSYSIPSQLAVTSGLELADGVDPLYLAEYDQFMQIASGIPRKKYDVTIPAMDGEPGEDLLMVNQDAVPNPDLLGVLNVRYIVAKYPIASKGLYTVGKFGDTYLYENIKDLPRVYSVKNIIEANSFTEAMSTMQNIDLLRCAVVEKYLPEMQLTTDVNIEWIRYTPNSIVLSITSRGRAFIVISQVFHPDWKAFVDSSPVELFKTNGVVSGLLIEQGNHIIRLDYRPSVTFTGLIVSFISVTICMIGLWRNAKITNEHGL